MDRSKIQSGASKGIALPLLVISIPVFLIVVAFAVSLVRARFTATKYQTISDIAAKVGAGEACSTLECYRNSRVRALRYIEQELFGAEEILDSEQEDTSWEHDGVRIDIVRGRWLEDFEEMEKTWDNQNPGIPAFINYNSVKIRLERSTLENFLPMILPGALGIVVNSTAVAKRPSQGECVAPFAIPLCSLLDGQGLLHRETLCDADRLLTESKRYCKDDELNCDKVPEFNFAPIADPSRSAEIFFNDPDAIIQTTTFGKTIVGCNYHSPRYQNAADNFGVVGLPGNDPITEEDVQVVLQSPHGCKSSAKIGDTFQILDGGLTSQLSGELVSEIALNSENSRDPANYRSISELGWEILTLIDMRFMGDDLRSGCTSGLIQGVTRRPSFGVCGSSRNHWGDWQKFVETASMPYNMCHLSRGVSGNAWKTRVPVIAESGADARDCKNDLSVATREGDYQIIGFLTLYIYDSDIGRGPAALFDMNPEPMPDTYSALRRCSFIGIQALNVTDDPPNAPFSFRPYDTPRACNVVRSRIDCKSSIFPSADDTAENDPYLIQ